MWMQGSALNTEDINNLVIMVQIYMELSYRPTGSMFQTVA
jgi:hypothetical protein